MPISEAPKMELFMKIVNGFERLVFSQKSSS